MKFVHTFPWEGAIIILVKTPQYIIYFLLYPIVKIPSPKKTAPRCLFYFIGFGCSKGMDIKCYCHPVLLPQNLNKQKRHWENSMSFLMPATGIEPVLCFHNRILSPARLPVPPRRHLWNSVLWMIRKQWAEVDSNHRSKLQQIYSLSPLATRESAHFQELLPDKDWL